MKVETVKAEKREASGTRAVRRLRQTGQIPGVIYGHGLPATNVSLERRAVEALLAHGTHVVNIEMAGGNQSCLLKDVQFDHLGATPVHVDLARVDLEERVQVKVPLELKGHARGLGEGGALVQNLIDIEIECRAVDIPDAIRVNISDLGVNSALHVRDIALPEGITARQDPEMIVVACREVTQPVAAPATAAPTETATEPEVIAKGKVEKEEGEE